MVRGGDGADLIACGTPAFKPFADAVSLDVMREAWLAALDAPALNKRFRAGGVTFCTLMPMRAVPFRVVCLLGMNDGDFPRRAPKADFDLLAQPGMARPGDRSRRDDEIETHDLQLRLIALGYAIAPEELGGAFGASTEAAIRAFQGQMGLRFIF